MVLVIFLYVCCKKCRKNDDDDLQDLDKRNRLGRVVPVDASDEKATGSRPSEVAGSRHSRETIQKRASRRASRKSVRVIVSDDDNVNDDVSCLSQR